MKKIKGILIMYSATGETSRLQFIGNKSMNKKGKIVNYEQVYDVQEGDKVKVMNKDFYNLEIILNERMLDFITGVACMYKKELKAEFIPVNSKSWDEISWNGIM